MSLTLTRSGGLEAKTNVGWAATEAGPFHSLWLHGGRTPVEVPLSKAVDAIQGVVETSVSEGDTSMKALQNYLRTSYVTPIGGAGGEWIRPTPEGNKSLSQALIDVDDSQKPVDFLGNTIDRRDFIYFVEYVMTNTWLCPEVPTETQDPRLAIIGLAAIGLAENN